jgi:hypothetical protein
MEAEIFLDGGKDRKEEIIMEYIHSFSYNEDEKKIRILDEHTVVVWKNVEKSVAEEALKLFRKAKSIDAFLSQHNCKRFRGYESGEEGEEIKNG